MVVLEGKIIRKGKCPVNKSIPCEDCEHYDGWGIDIKNHKIEIWCFNNNIIDAKIITLTDEKIKNKLR